MSVEATQKKLGLGHRINEDLRKKVDTISARGALGGRRGLSPSAALSSFVDFNIGTVANQKQTSTCVAHALSVALYVRAKKLGAPFSPVGVIPSRPGIYWAALAIERRLSVPADAPVDVKLPDLLDQGSDPILAGQGVGEFGACLETDWSLGQAFPDADAGAPDGQPFVVPQPPFGALETGQTFTLRDVLQVQSVGPERVLDVQQAIDTGFPVPVGMLADQAMMQYGPNSPPLGASNKATGVGGHMPLLLDYYVDPAFGLVFLGANWWGSDWGRNGYFLCTPDFITADTTNDLLLVEGHAGVTQAVSNRKLAAHAKLAAVKEKK